MASFTFNPLHQKQLFSSSIPHCKCPSTSTLFNFHCSPHLLSLSSSTRPPQSVVSAVGTTNVSQIDAATKPSTVQEISKNTKIHRPGKESSDSGFSNLKSREQRVAKKPVKDKINSIVEDILEKSVRKDRQKPEKRRSEKGSKFYSIRSSDSNLENKFSSSKGDRVVNEKTDKKSDKTKSNDNQFREKTEKSSKKKKVDSAGAKLRMKLDMCSKRGDVMGAIELYDLAQREGIAMGQYHYTVLLYLCSSAATGVVQPAKSGSSGRSLSGVESSTSEVSEGVEEFRELGEGNSDGTKLNGSADPKDGIRIQEDKGIQVSGDVKKYALEKGFEIYEEMRLVNVPMNEATLTSVARMAMSMGNGDMAFDMVNQMKELGINPRLRSYGPALSVFCKNGDVEKAFSVEEHMLEHGVYPEEPELEALLRVSIEAGRSDKVYYLLHKLRTSVRKVSPSTAEMIQKWFDSKIASRVGKRKWDKKLIREAIENGGGGWHGKGWLGKGKWSVSRTYVGDDGLCKCCGEKLATIDLDPTETENFAKSVASIAIQREKNSSFQKFQKWLDYYGPFEAVVDAANVGMFSQRKFNPSKVNAVVNGIRQMLPSKKWPLIVLHNRRVTGDRMDKPVNVALVERWRNADALYATPTGSNDDWYWLYAAIKFKCLIVTNDEMRDHLFQLLGNDFFPKWKERHQVHFTFTDVGPVFHMPPPCSVVIQESEKGHWHIPIASEHNSEGERTWLCVTRANSHAATQDSATTDEEPVKSQFPHNKKRHESSDAQQAQTRPRCGNHVKTKQPPREIYRNLRNILLTYRSKTLPEIEAAEKLGNCVIDFQI